MSAESVDPTRRIDPVFPPDRIKPTRRQERRERRDEESRRRPADEHPPDSETHDESTPQGPDDDGHLDILI